MWNPCYFRKKRKSLKFSQFEFELRRLPCYFGKRRKGIKFSQFEFEFMRHVCYFGNESKSLKFSHFEFEFMRHPCYFWKERKSSNGLLGWVIFMRGISSFIAQSYYNTVCKVGLLYCEYE